MSHTIELKVLLELFGRQIESLGVADGYALNLRDANAENLISLKLRFTPEFQFLEETYYQYKVPLTDESLNVSAHAFLRRGISAINSADSSGEQLKLLTLWKLHEIVAIPLMQQNTPDELPIGTIQLLKEQGKVAPDSIRDVQELIALFYMPLCNALEFSFLKDHRARYEAAAAEHARFLQFIVEMNNLTSPDRIYEMFTKELFRQLPFDGVAFSLVENNALVNKKTAVADPRYQGVCDEWDRYARATPYSLSADDGGVSHTLLHDAPLFFPDVQKIMHLPMSDKDRRTMEILKTVRTLLIIPIRYQDKPIGVILFYTLAASLAISEADLHLLEHLSSFLGTALTNSRNYAVSQEQNREIERLNLILQDRVKELGDQAATDGLTGLYNFRTFENELVRRVSECKRNSERNGLSIAIIDIDHFKQFNDKHGHSAGNDVLAGVAVEINKLVRKMDLACRYGGEEFVVILSKCEEDGIQIFSERLRAAIEVTAFETSAGSLSVTVSIGCTTYNFEDTPATLFKRADQALYRAKEKGRNRIESV